MARKTRWLDNFTNLTIASGGTSVQNLRGPESNIDLQGMTLTRTIMRLTMQSTTVAGAWGSMRMGIGVGVASEQALLAGAGSIPNPDDEVAYPPGGWILRDRRSVTQNGVGGQIAFDFFWDLRAQRRLVGGQPFIVIHNDADLGTAFNVKVALIVRLLMRLP